MKTLRLLAARNLLRFINYIKFSPPDACADLWIKFGEVCWAWRDSGRHTNMKIFDNWWKLFLLADFSIHLNIFSSLKNLRCVCAIILSFPRRGKTVQLMNLISGVCIIMQANLGRSWKLCGCELWTTEIVLTEGKHSKGVNKTRFTFHRT